jgi:RNA polymerase sigma factor (sigma-70 family)
LARQRNRPLRVASRCSTLSTAVTEIERRLSLGDARLPNLTRGSVAFQELATRYRKPLRRFFERRVQSKPDSDDLVQEVFVRLIRQDNIGAIEHLDSYVFQVAANVLRDHARRWTVRAEEVHHTLLDDDTLEGGFSPERVLLGAEALENLISALYALPEKTRIIFTLYHFESVPQVEIARRLGMSISTLEKHMSRANFHLLEHLGRPD